MKMKLGEHMKRLIRLVKQKWLYWVISLVVLLLIGFSIYIYDYYIVGQTGTPLETYLISSVILFLIYFIPYIILSV